MVRSLFAPFVSIRFSILHEVKARVELARQRRALAKLDDHALKDIGVTRREAQTEATRSVWDAPENWRF